MEDIVSHAAMEDIVSHAAMEDIVSHAAMEDIVSHAAMEDIVSLRQWRTRQKKRTLEVLRALKERERTLTRKTIFQGL